MSEVGAVAASAVGGDPLGTAVLRERVAAVWQAAPARFREDANAEEDLALGAYRDRLVIELAQNAADAAARAGEPGRLRLSVRDGVLVAANTGAPLDAAGAEALSNLRTSAKAGDEAAIGRFGVGFTAVLAVSDEPAILTRHGGVGFSRARARAFAEAVPGLDAELKPRGDRVPVLRVPFAADTPPPDGYDTAVVLPLRDSAADALVRRLLGECDDALLLALPALGEVVVEIDGLTRVLTAHAAEGADETDGGGRIPTAHARGDVVEVADDGVATRWLVRRAGGRLDPALLADRPTEERLRPSWSLAWAVPIDADGQPLAPRTPRVLHAPTRSDEPLDLPALLIATFPLDSTRRRPAPGPLTDHLLDAAAATYAALLADWHPEPSPRAVAPLLPGPVGAGEFDARLRVRIAEQLADAAFLPVFAAGGRRVRPRDAVLLDDATRDLVDLLAPHGTLLPPDWSVAARALVRLGVRRMSFADAVDLLASVDRPPHWWRRLYDAFAGAVAGHGPGVDVDALGGLPVPLADGRTVRGPRGLLLPEGPLADDLAADDEPAPGPDHLSLAQATRTLGLRLVHPAAVHPLLERLGARGATPRALLGEGAVRAAVAASFDADDPEELADAVLTVVRAAHPAAGEEPWLADLVLLDADGEPAPAGELALPDSPLAQIVEEGAVGLVDPALTDRWGSDVLLAVGVLADLELVRDENVLLDPAALEHDLDGMDAWCADTLDLIAEAGPPVVAEFTAVRDLDLVAADHWPRALAMVARPPLRRAVTEPARVLLPDGGTRDAVPYTAWWLREQPVLGGRRPVDLRAADADPLLRGLYDDVSPHDVRGLDAAFVGTIGLRTTLAALLADRDGPADLLERLADPTRPVGAAQLAALYTALAGLDPTRVAPPAAVRALAAAGGGGPEGAGPVGPGEPVTVVVAGESAVVVEAPDLLPLVRAWPVLPVAPRVAAEFADLLAVPLASELADAAVLGGGDADEHPVPPVVRLLLPHAPTTYVEHDELRVAAPEGSSEGVAVDWRYDDGVVHAATVDGLAHGLAWAAGAWERRHELAWALADPERAGRLLVERLFEEA